jgi:hypothetical protein
MTPTSAHATSRLKAKAPLERRAILVLGMHRSGTSALTRVLGLCGAVLPGRVLGPTPDNIKGFWEPPEIVAIHDELLATLSSDWDDPSEFPLDWLNSPSAAAFEKRLRSTFSDIFGDQDLVVLKDPRICRFVPLWISILKSLAITPVFVIAIRNPLEVAASLKARDRMPEAKALLLWLRHFLEAERHTRKSTRCFINYEEMLRDWRGTMAKIARKLKISWPTPFEHAAPYVEEFLSAELRHNVLPNEAISVRPDISPWLKDAYNWALEACEGRPQKTSKLDRVNAALRTADLIFLPIIDPAERRLRIFSEEMGRLETLSQNRSSELSKATEEIGRLETELSKATEEIGRLETELSKATEEIGRLETLLQDRNSELSKVTEQLSRFETLLHKRDSELNMALARVASLEERTDEQSRRQQLLDEALGQSRRRALELEGTISALLLSTSWRLTAPLRHCMRAMHSARKAISNTIKMFSP